MNSRVAPIPCSTPRSYVARYLENWVSRAFYNYDEGIAEMSRRRNVATLSYSLTSTSVGQTSRRCNVATLQRRDVAAGSSLLLLQIYNKLLKATMFTCNAQNTQK